jgi:hypothetical protein
MDQSVVELFKGARAVGYLVVWGIGLLWLLGFIGMFWWIIIPVAFLALVVGAIVWVVKSVSTPVQTVSASAAIPEDERQQALASGKWIVTSGSAGEYIAEDLQTIAEWFSQGRIDPYSIVEHQSEGRQLCRELLKPAIPESSAQSPTLTSTPF